jgi:hypothetical protein
MKKFLPALLGVVIFLGISSCSKDEDTAKRSEVILGKNWTITAMTINPAINFLGIPISDFYSFMSDCEKDNFLTYFSSGSVIQDEGLTKCETTDPQQTNGSYWWSADEKVLTQVFEGDTLSLTIESFSDKKVVGKYVMVEDMGEGEKTYTYMVTMEVK